MWNWFKKLQIKGFAAGVLVTVLLSGTLLVTAQTVTREIVYGVRVNLNGQLLQFDADSQPFTMGGRTFLPVRALADALELPVDFNPATNTVYLGNRFAGQRQALNIAAPSFDNGGTGPSDSFRNTTLTVVDSVAMGGAAYQNALSFNFTANQSNPHDGYRFSLHNLNSQFRMLTGYVGRVDGTGMSDGLIRFIGDGSLLSEYDLRATNMPIPISVFVEGVSQLRIEVHFLTNRSGQARGTQYALVAFVE